MGTGVEEVVAADLIGGGAAAEMGAGALAASEFGGAGLVGMDALAPAALTSADLGLISSGAMLPDAIGGAAGGISAGDVAAGAGAGLPAGGAISPPLSIASDGATAASGAGGGSSAGYNPMTSSPVSGGVGGLPVGGADAGSIAGEEFGGGGLVGMDGLPPAAATPADSLINPSMLPDASGGMSLPPPGSGTVLQKILNKMSDNPLTTAALGTNLASGIAQRNSSGQLSNRLQSIGAPAQQAGQTLLQQYQSGQINPGSAFDINQWEQQAISQARDYAARSGTADSSSSRQAIADIQSKANAMRDQSRQGLLTSGLSALGVGSGPLSAAATASANQDTQFAQSQASALNSLMLLQALQAKQAGGA